MIYVITILIGMVAGTLGSLLGIGGGLIMLPAIQLILGFETVIAVGTTLFAVIFTAISGAFGHYKNGNVVIKYSLYVGCGGIIGVVLGSYVFKQYLSNSAYIIEILLGVLFTLMAVRMAADLIRELKNITSQQAVLKQHAEASKWGLALLGFITGTLTGTLGLGGGFIMVPAMIWLFSVSPFQAVGTTLLAMFPIASLGGFIKVYHGFVDLPAGFLLGLGTIIGAQLGVRISRYINQLVFKGAFTVIFIYMAFNYLSSSLYRLGP